MEDQEIANEVDRITNGKGARVIFDPVGGKRASELMNAASESGIYFLYGALDFDPISLDPMTVLGKSLTIRGFQLMEILQNPVRRTKAVEFVNAGLASGKLKPAIAKTFALDQIVEAHSYMESNAQIGKIVVTV